jgi:hypothetical protein
MLQIQLYVNRYPNVLRDAVSDAIGGPPIVEIAWKSPLKDDQFREYRDGSFLEKLGLSQYRDELAAFWPSKGPCWDALGVAHMHDGTQRVLLVEAKSYPEEADSTIGAKAASSVERIKRSMAATSAFNQMDTLPSIWIDGRFQAANRLAHLYFLTQVCGVEASLVFVCFTDDPTHPANKRIPLAAWRSSNEQLWLNLGLAGRPPDTHVAYVPGLNRPMPDPTNATETSV